MIFKASVYNPSLLLKLAPRNLIVPQIFDPYQPETYHKDVHQSKTLNNVLFGSPGLGKTIFGCIETVRFVSQGKGNGLIIMPTYSMLFDIAMKELRKWLPQKYIIPRSKQASNIWLDNGRCIFLRSAEHLKTIEGLDSVAFVWMDEGDLIDVGAWERVKERLRRQSGLGHLEKRVIITGTPELNSNGSSWVRDEIYDKFLNNHPKNFARIGTIWECSRYSREELDEIERENPKGTWSRSRLDGEWVLPKEGHVFRDMPIIGQPFSEYPLLESEEIILGVDCGFDDPFVFGILGRKKDIWTVFHEYRNKDVHEDVMAKEIVIMIEKLGLRSKFNCYHQPNHHGLKLFHDHDPNQMGKLAQELDRYKIRFKYLPADKLDKKISIQFIRDMIFKNKLQFAPGAKDTYTDFCGYKFSKSVSRDITEHKNSHGPDMVRYALWTHARGKQETLMYKR